jgi:hypothetical protein
MRARRGRHYVDGPSSGVAVSVERSLWRTGASATVKQGGSYALGVNGCEWG